MEDEIKLVGHKNSEYDLTIVNSRGITVLRDRGDLEPMLDVLIWFRQQFDGEMPDKTVWYFGERSRESYKREGFEYLDGDKIDW